MALILTDFHDSIGTITLNHDCKRNALSGALIQELIKAFNDLIYQGARVIILRANKGAQRLVGGLRHQRIPPAGPGPAGV